jgi:hypothetical protein
MYLLHKNYFQNKLYVNIVTNFEWPNKSSAISGWNKTCLKYFALQELP